MFGQPRLRASLRDLRPPRRSRPSTVEADLKRLILMDGDGGGGGGAAAPAGSASAAGGSASGAAPVAGGAGLPRTLSDESLCGAYGAVTSEAEGGAYPCSTLPGRRAGPAPPERRREWAGPTSIMSWG